MKLILALSILIITFNSFSQEDQVSFRRHTGSIEFVHYPNIGHLTTSVNNFKLNYIFRSLRGHRIFLGAAYQNSRISPAGYVIFQNDTASVGRTVDNQLRVHSVDVSTSYEIGLPFSDKTNLWIGPYIGASFPFQVISHTEKPDIEGIFTTNARIENNPSLQFGLNVSWQYRLKRNSVEFLLRIKTYQKISSYFEANLTGYSPTVFSLREPRGFLGLGLRYTFL